MGIVSSVVSAPPEIAAWALLGNQRLVRERLALEAEGADTPPGAALARVHGLDDAEAVIVKRGVSHRAQWSIVDDSQPPSECQS
jgi:hypothetical protein